MRRLSRGTTGPEVGLLRRMLNRRLRPSPNLPEAKVFGAPDLPLLMIEHPLGGIQMDEVRARAQQALPKVLELIEAAQREQAA